MTRARAWLVGGLFLLVAAFGLIALRSRRTAPRQAAEVSGTDESEVRAESELSFRQAESRERQAATRVESPEHSGNPVDVEPVPVEADDSVHAATRTITGILIDAANGRPLPEHRLAFRVLYGPDRATDLELVTTDAAGRFLTQPLPCDELYVRYVVDVEDPERAVGYWLAPLGFSLPPDPEGTPFELRIEGRSPRDVLAVDVRHADGSPAPGARALLHLIQSQEDSDSPFITDGVVVANSKGRARFGLESAQRVLEGSVYARGSAGTVSPVLALEIPLELGVRTLFLGRAGELRLRVRWATGEPASGLGVQLRGPAVYRIEERTDARGRLSLRELVPGEHVVFVENPRTGRMDRSSSIDVAPGDVLDLELELAEGDRRIGIAGRVLDENGEPLAGVRLTVLPSAGWEEHERSDDEGRFEWWGRPCDAVQLRLDVGPHADLFDPGSPLVPFGSRAVVFRRRAKAEDVRFRLIVTDRTTGEVLPRAFATFDRGVDTEAWSSTYAPRELYVLPANDGTRMRVVVVGFLPAMLTLLPALKAATESPPVLRIALLPGLSHTFRIRDEQTDEPVAGVQLASPTAPGVRSDAEGWVRVEADHWSVYRVTKEGYEPVDWDPSETVPFDQGVLHVTRLD